MSKSNFFENKTLTILGSKGVKVIKFSVFKQVVIFLLFALSVFLFGGISVLYLQERQSSNLYQEEIGRLAEANQSLIHYVRNVDQDLDNIYEFLDFNGGKKETLKDIFLHKDIKKKKNKHSSAAKYTKLSYAALQGSKEKLSGVFRISNFYLSEFIGKMESVGILASQIIPIERSMISKIKLNSIYSNISPQHKSYSESEPMFYLRSLALGNGDPKDIQKKLRNAIILRDFISSLPLGSPINVPYRITSLFGKRFHPVLKTAKAHNGLDLAGPKGTPIFATGSGYVMYAQYSNAYGYSVLIKHNKSGKLLTRYAHLKRNVKVKKGDYVKVGDLVGYQGSSGMVTGEHLHYEVIFNNHCIDPIKFLKNNYSYDIIAKIKKN